MTADAVSEAIQGAQLRSAEKDMEETGVVAPPTHSTGYEEPEDFPSEEDQQTLRRVADHIPLKLFTIAFIELCERFSYYGTVVLYTNFIQHPLPDASEGGNPYTGAGGPGDGQSGVLGMGQRASTGITTFNQFWQYVMPLLGAYVADEYWGRYKTVFVALGIDILGHLILILSAIPPVIARPKENSLAALIVGILAIGFGTGGFKPNISPMIVEQLPMQHMRVRTLKSGERVIIDPAATINRVYNWFYMFINIGALVGQLAMVYAEKYVGFYLSFALPTAMLCLCPAVMWWGRTRYTRLPPAGSVLRPALRTFALANKGRWSINPYTTIKRLNDGTFWESVKPSKFTDATRPAWMTFDDAWVDELRRGFAACSVFCWLPIYWLTYNQLNNNLVSQAAVMRLDGLPNDVFTNLNPLSLIIFIPICDFIVYPALRRFKIRFTPIRRITLGFFTGSMAMVWAAVIQAHIYQTSECGHYAAGKGCANVGLSVWAQTGSYVLIALSEIFTSITSLEYAYSKAPKSMRSMVQAVALFAVAVSAAIGQALVALSEDPLLVWNYGAVAVLAAAAGVIFWLQYRGLDAEEDSLNELPEGKVPRASSSEDEENGRAADEKAG